MILKLCIVAEATGVGSCCRSVCLFAYASSFSALDRKLPGQSTGEIDELRTWINYKNGIVSDKCKRNLNGKDVWHDTGEEYNLQ